MKIYFIIGCFILGGIASAQKEGQELDALVKELTKDAGVDQLLKKTKKKKWDPKKLTSGLRSQVDQSCLNQKAAASEYRLKFKDLEDWGSACRKIQPKGCRVDGKKADATCEAQMEKLYPYQLTKVDKRKVAKACMIYTLSCPKKK